MPSTMNLSVSEDRTAAIEAYTQAGLFAEEVLPQLRAAHEELRAVIAKIESAMPVNGRALRGALAQDQERFDSAAKEAQPLVRGILAFADERIGPITDGLLALAAHPVVKEVLPVLVQEDDGGQ